MKNCAILIALIAICFGCEKNYYELRLLSTDFSLSSLGEVHINSIYGGSGNFVVSIDDPLIADVMINAKNEIVTEAKQKGSAVITVTDKKTGDKVFCNLIVRDFIDSFRIVSMQYAVDVEDPATRYAIKEDLKIPPYPQGTVFQYIRPFGVSGQPDLWVVKMPTGETVNGIVTFQKVTGSSGLEYFDAYRLLPIEGLGKEYFRLYHIDFGDKKAVYYVYGVEGPPVDGLVSRDYHERYYEDLTDHYKSLYPDGMMSGVVRVLQGY